MLFNIQGQRGLWSSLNFTRKVKEVQKVVQKNFWTMFFLC